MMYLLATLFLFAIVLIVLKPNGKIFYCTKCSGVMKPDPYVYKNIIVWTCDNCGDKKETLA